MSKPYPTFSKPLSGAPNCVAFTLALAVSGCQGHVASQEGDSPGTGGTGARDGKMNGMEPGPGPAGPKALVYPPRLRRLTHAQYEASVHQLLGQPDLHLDPPPPDPLGRNYETDARLLGVPEALARHYAAVASTVVSAVDSDKVQALAGCAPGTDGCGGRFIAALLPRAFRRPAEAADLARYQALFDMAAALEEPLLPYRAVLRALLVSPHLLYRTEVGDPRATAADTAKMALTNHEIATALSFDILNAPPDDELRALADAGELTDPETLRETVRLLVGRADARARVVHFLQAWAEVEPAATIDKDPKAFAKFAAVRPQIDMELKHFLGATVASGTWSDLLLAPIAPHTGADLQKFYGTGDAPARMGVLGTGAFLATQAKYLNTSPTLRGQFIRDRILCQDVQLPADSVDTDVDKIREANADATTREIYQLHMSEPSCRGCHQMMDPLAFPLEVFDAAGRARATENGQTIDTAGEILGTDVDGPVTDHVALLQQLARSEMARTCLAAQAFRFFLGHGPPGDDPTRIARASETLSDGASFADLVTDLLADPLLYTRFRE